ncbi:unnamed protein product, partial [Prorocentrum cordatum]
LPARSLAQPRDSTRVVPAVPCCRSQPHCSSGSRGRDGKTAGEPPTSRRREQITMGASPPQCARVVKPTRSEAWALAAGCRWTPEASGRAAQRRARATGAPAPADRPALARGAPGPGQRRALLRGGGPSAQISDGVLCSSRRLSSTSVSRGAVIGSQGHRSSTDAQGRAGQGRDADAARWRSLGQAELHRLRSAVTPAAQRSVRISVAGQFPPHLCGRGEPPAAVPRGDAAAPRGARHHSSCARPSVTSRLTQSLPRLPSAAASCSRTARPMDTAP